MIIGDRLRSIREEKNLSRGGIEKRTGLFRCYVSRVENGHTVPTVETIENFARAPQVPMYQLLYDGKKPPELPHLLKRKTADEVARGSTGKDARYLTRFRRLLAKQPIGPKTSSFVRTESSCPQAKQCAQGSFSWSRACKCLSQPHELTSTRAG